MDDIGSTDDTALLCHINEPAARLIVGDWFDPNGNKVGSDSDSKPGDVPGFKRNRGSHVVRLKRSSDGTPPEGVYIQVCCEGYNGHKSNSLCGHLFWYVFGVLYNLLSSVIFAGISSSTLFSSSMPTGESVTRTSSIFMPSEVNVAITSSTTEGTTSSHKTPTQTVVYGTSGEIKTSKTQFDYASSATLTQTVVHSSSEGSTHMLSTSIRELLPRQGATPLYSISTFFKARPTSTEPNPR